MSPVRNKLVAIAALATALLAAALPCAAGKVTDFTADQVTLGAGDSVKNQGKIYASGDKVRMEGFMPESGANLIIIIRRDQKKQLMVNPGQKSYFEQPLDEKQLEGDVMAHVKSRTEKKIGEETVGGYACIKKEIQAEVEIMGMRQKTRSIVWQSARFDLPLRTQTEDGRITEMRNIKEGRPADSLFEVPPGYTRVAGMMELMGAGMGGPGPSEKAAGGGGKGGARPPAKLPPGFKLPFPKQ